MAVVLCQSQHLGGDVLGQAVSQVFAVGVQHLGHASDLRGGLCGCSGVVAGDQHVHVAAAGQRRGDGVECGALDRLVVVFGNDE